VICKLHTLDELVDIIDQEFLPHGRHHPSRMEDPHRNVI